MQLRKYQEQSVSGVRTAYTQGYKAPLLVLPTGGGKTIVFSFIAKNAAAKGTKVLILVHRVELLKQTANKLREFGVRVGLISPKFGHDPSASVHVAMVQTMVKRLYLFSEFGLIITDEAHHAISPTYKSVIEYYTNTFQLGVTATPIRADGRGLGVKAGGVFDTLVVGPTVAQLIKMGYLVEPIVYASKSPPDLSGVKRNSKGDYNKRKLGEAMNKPQLTGSVVQHYMDITPGEPGVAFCASVKHAEQVAADFRAQGYKFYALSGQTDDNVRNDLIRGLGDGSIHGITSCDVISEGTDIPAISVAMLLRPTQSLGLYLQQVGRALRPSEGKERAIILDHAGNTFRHGFADDDRMWSLEGRPKGSRINTDTSENVHQCEECFAVFSSYLKECSQCGEPRKISARELKVVEGQLERLEAIDKQRINKERRQKTGRAKTLEELQAVAKEFGYNPGWANHIFKARAAKANN